MQISVHVAYRKSCLAEQSFLLLHSLNCHPYAKTLVMTSLRYNAVVISASDTRLKHSILSKHNMAWSSQDSYMCLLACESMDFLHKWSLYRLTSSWIQPGACTLFPSLIYEAYRLSSQSAREGITGCDSHATQVGSIFWTWMAYLKWSCLCQDIYSANVDTSFSSYLQQLLLLLCIEWIITR